MKKVMIICNGNVARSPNIEILSRFFSGRYSGVEFFSGGADTVKIEQKLNAFSNKFGMTPEEYVRQKGYLPHIQGDKGNLSVNYEIYSDERLVGAPPAYWVPLNSFNPELGRDGARKVRRAVTQEDLELADLVLVVTEGLKEEISKRIPNKEAKVKLLARYGYNNTNNLNLDDPFDLVDKTCGIYRNLDGVETVVSAPDFKPSIEYMLELAYGQTFPNILRLAHGLAESLR